jgi:NAD-dependent DNA ligase
MKYTIETLKNKYGFDSEHELINLYKESKDSYYNDGTSILSDFEFDELENVLLHYGKIDKNVGIISENILHEKMN